MEYFFRIANDINKIKNSLYNESHLEDSMIESVEDDTTRQILVADSKLVLYYCKFVHSYGGFNRYTISF